MAWESRILALRRYSGALMGLLCSCGFAGLDPPFGGKNGGNLIPLGGKMWPLVCEAVGDYGLSWRTVQTMLGVSANEIHRWRREGVPESHRFDAWALLTYLAILERALHPAVLRHAGGLGNWLEMPVMKKTTITPAMLYGRDKRILNNWILREWIWGDILADFDPDWRERYAPDPNFEVGIGPDGERAIVPKAKK